MFFILSSIASHDSSRVLADPASHRPARLMADTITFAPVPEKYTQSLKYIKKAKELAPHCPLVLWSYAGTLAMLEKDVEAIAIYKKIIRKPLKTLAFGECGEGMKRAQSMICDSYYRLSRCYTYLGNKRWGRYYLEKHIAERKNGTKSIYLMSKVKMILNEINAM